MTDNDVRRIEDKVDNVALVLARLEGSLSPTLEKLTDQQKEQDDTLGDHEARLRAVERFRYSVPSIAVLALLLDAAIGLYLTTRGFHNG
jgi:hypothetical protein